MSSFYLSAAHKSSGKTCVSIGLSSAMVKRGISVQTFKRGPDYIDPIWLKAASGNPCYNLDFNCQSHREICDLFNDKSMGVKARFVEGSKGLFDGVNPNGCDSNAALAKLLSLPIILVIDCNGMSRGIAPLLLGYKAFDEKINIAGVILNKTGGTRHEGKLRQAVENYTDIPVLGLLRKSSSMEIPERHLGLMPANEMNAPSAVIENITNAVENDIDIDAIMTLGQQNIIGQTPTQAKHVNDITIAIARDASFGFYYPDDLEAFAKAGAKLVFFDAINDLELPPCDGLFIGGGFPETQMKALSENRSMRRSIKNALSAGLPCYAECGGLMYLCREISFQGESAKMVGIIDGKITMQAKPQGRGLVKLETTGSGLWPDMATAGYNFNAHEFHYAQLDELGGNAKYTYAVKRGHGINGKYDGLIIGNCTASFSHLRNTKVSPWVQDFVNFVRRQSKSR